VLTFRPESLLTITGIRSFLIRSRRHLQPE
jgi:hypothetical protein